MLHMSFGGFIYDGSNYMCQHCAVDIVEMRSSLSL